MDRGKPVYWLRTEKKEGEQETEAFNLRCPSKKRPWT